MRPYFPSSFLFLLFAACSEGGFRGTPEWNGIPLTPVPHAEASPDGGMPAQGVAPLRLLQTEGRDGGPAMELREFSGIAAAYLAFQELASSREEFRAGFVIRGEHVHFVRGRWMGSMALADWPGHDALWASLVLPVRRGEEGHVPGAFASMLHHGRFSGSERILVHEFLGHPLEFAVFAVLLDCHGDPAWLYASARASDALKEHVRRVADEAAQGSQHGFGGPLEAHFAGRGMVVVEGCFDESLARFWLQAQSRALKRLKLKGSGEIFRNFD